MGFELAAEEIQLKLNQNHVAGNVRGAIEGLRKEGSGEFAEVASWMEAVLIRR